MNDIKHTYITGTFDIYGRFCPMGFSKDYEYAVEIAKLHKQVVCRLEVVEDWREER